MKNTLYTLPVKGAAALAIPATQFSRRVEICEDEAATPQGIVVFYPGDGFTQGYTVLPDKQPVEIGNARALGKGAGVMLGFPAQVVATDGGPVTTRAADTLFKATSASATATKIRVTEYD